jgi:hypothetical protein
MQSIITIVKEWSARQAPKYAEYRFPAKRQDFRIACVVGQVTIMHIAGALYPPLVALLLRNDRQYAEKEHISVSASECP